MKYFIKKHHVNDIQIDEIIIENNNGLKLSLINYGASIYNIYLDNLLLTVCGKDLSFYTINGSSFGKTIGRIAGRIEDAVLTVDDIDYYLEKNNNNKNTLHCGTSNLGNKLFDYKIIENNDNIEVIFKYLSLEEEAIIPGDVNIEVIYMLYKDQNKIKIEYRCISNKNTYLNITNHTFYNLSGNFKTGIENHTLMINSKLKGKTDDYLNVQEIESCNEFFDFTTEKLIKNNLFTKEVLKRVARGYDDVFILENSKDLAVSLYSPMSNIRMNLRTSYPSIVVYTGSYPPFMEQIEKVDNKFLFDSICFEPQYVPNGYKLFGKDYMYLKKDEMYNHFIELSFNKE